MNAPAPTPGFAGLTAARRLDGAEPEVTVIDRNGYLARLLWGMIHVFFLVGSRNRLAVLTEWLWVYVSFRRGARLITGSDS
jgi:NADH dehydrogenase FAD-containing subunit